MKKPSAILRPVAWLCAIVMLCAVDALSGQLCKLGKCVALIWASALMMIRGKAAAEDRHHEVAAV